MYVLGRSQLLLLLFAHNGQGRDGCKGFNAYTGFLGATLEDIGYDYWKCGDNCTHYNSECLCGNETLKHSDDRWCCGSQCTRGSCLWWKSTQGFFAQQFKEGDNPEHCAEWSPAVCTNGAVLDLTQTCNNTCNEHLQDQYRNKFSPRSHISACKAPNTCIKEGEGISGHFNDKDYKSTICTGDASCEGELAWCKEEERKIEICPIGFSRCLPTLGGSKNKTIGKSANNIPGQCIPVKKSKDGNIFHCMDRTDENPFQRRGSSVNEQMIDLKQLKSCPYWQQPGLLCGVQHCVLTSAWCAESFSPKECQVLGPGILTNNPRVCQEISFWREQPCPDDHIRCRAGNSGQCVAKKYWGVEGAKDDRGQDVSCKDGSDLYSETETEATCEANNGFICNVRQLLV